MVRVKLVAYAAKFPHHTRHSFFSEQQVGTALPNSKNSAELLADDFFLFQSLVSSGHFSNKNLCACVSLLGQQLFYSLSTSCGLSLVMEKNEVGGLLNFKREHSGKNSDAVAAMFAAEISSSNAFYQDALIKNYIFGIKLLKKEYNEQIHFCLLGLDGKNILGDA